MRVPFLEVVEDDNLLGRVWKTLSWPQRVTLKAFYGCPLSGSLRNPATGWSELDYWAIVQGSCEYDELGYVTRVTPLEYRPEEYRQVWAVVGRRAGKTSQLMSIILVYEAVFGGHEQYVQAKQKALIYYIAQLQEIAQENMNLITSVVDSSPIVSQEVVKNNADGILFKNNIWIIPGNPSIKAQRGVAVPVVAFDEVAFWYKDATSANPDYEVERAVSFAQLQFPNSKKVGISTPWTEEGLLWKYHKAGTNGRKLPLEKRKPYKSKLAIFAPTAAYENPSITRKKLDEIRQEDPEAFDRESLCKFMGSVSGAFNKELVEIAVQKGYGLSVREPITTGSVIPSYVAAIDPGFRQDSFGFGIAHKDSAGDIVVDLLQSWTPLKGQKLNPKIILTEIKPILDSYNIVSVYSDQYQFESLREIALDLGYGIENVDFTNRSKVQLFGNLENVVKQKKLQLLDPDENPAARDCAVQMLQLEKRRTPTGALQYSAPPGKHDDMACVLALVVSKAIWFHPVVTDQSDQREMTLFERVTAQRERRNAELGKDDW